MRYPRYLKSVFHELDFVDKIKFIKNRNLTKLESSEELLRLCQSNKFEGLTT